MKLPRVTYQMVYIVVTPRLLWSDDIECRKERRCPYRSHLVHNTLHRGGHMSFLSPFLSTILLGVTSSTLRNIDHADDHLNAAAPALDIYDWSQMSYLSRLGPAGLPAKRSRGHLHRSCGFLLPSNIFTSSQFDQHDDVGLGTREPGNQFSMLRRTDLRF